MLESVTHKRIGHAHYVLPDFWASKFINYDESSLTDEEQAAVDAWLILRPELGFCVDVSGEPEFCTDHDADAHVKPCNCQTYTFELIKQD